MHNQKLFDKIRDTLTEETPQDFAPLDWDKNAVWERIETRNSPRRGFAFGRWAAVAAAFIGIVSVSYTHLDVYKRQGLNWAWKR